MTYNLEFEEHALKEFKKLAPVIRERSEVYTAAKKRL